MQVHFICKGNVYRSLMAEAYLKSLRIPMLQVISSGFAAKKYSKSNIPVIRFTLDYLNQKGLKKYAKSQGNQLTQNRLNDKDITICMNQITYNECSSRFALPSNTIIWNIDDTDEVKSSPKTDEELLAYTEKIFAQIKSNTDRLIKQQH
jgi:protein-tyrosine-phosphatase